MATKSRRSTDTKTGGEARRRTPSPTTEARSRIDLTTGTRNMVSCAGITDKDRVVIITDQKTLRVGEKLRDAVEETGAPVVFVMMEDLGERPLTSLPDQTVAAIRAADPTISFYAASTEDGELGFRKPLIGMLLGEFGVRHIHMPGTNEEVAGGQGMCADYDQVRKLTAAVFKEVKGAVQLKVTAPGTDLTIDLDPVNLKWIADDGMAKEQGAFVNLPDGEVWTTPLNVNGTFTTRLLGDYFDTKYGVLETPVTITIKDGKAVAVSCENKAIEQEVREYLKRGENTDRVGEAAIGTNIGVIELIGNILNDEKIFLRFHLAFGDPVGDQTGATWVATPDQHCDMIAEAGCTVTVDNKKTIITEGKLSISS